MEKISYEHYLAMLQNIDMSDEDLMEYSVVEPGKGMEIQIRPNPERVDMSAEQLQRENAMKIGNGIARWRRRSAFSRRSKTENLPVLVSEGDSWFQFPFLIEDVIDHLGKDYLIWSLCAAGDTADNMVHGDLAQGKTEYMAALHKFKSKVKGFLFSGAGNDIIGEDPETAKPVLTNLLKDFNGDDTDIIGHIDSEKLNAALAKLKTAYETVITNVRAEFPSLPIIIHGYDYVFPYPENPADPRDPRHTTKEKWLAPPMMARNIQNQALRRNIIKHMLDRLYAMLEELAGDSTVTKVWVVNCRGAMPAVSDWVDEIHGTSQGFAKVAERFRTVIRNAGIV